MTKAELIKLIEKLIQQIEYYEEREADYDDQLEQVKSENEHFSRSIHDYEQREREEAIYKIFPNMRQSWSKKDFDF
ncbi:hypothetical protein V7075_16275 [Neobacillus drentensis]|uniref:hypothetical protein n=1 Tax=Neobacillus drentensis TaxID=220684 RepID=UPI002FFDA44C